MLARGSRRRCAALTSRLPVTTWKPPSRHSCQTGDSSTVPSRRYVAKTASKPSPVRSPRSSHAEVLAHARTLTLDVGQALGELAISDADDVDAANMAVSPVVAPPNDGAGSAVRELLLDREPRLRRACQQLAPHLAGRVPAVVAGAVRRRRCGLEDDVIGDKGKHGVKIMGVHGGREAIHELKDRVTGVHAGILPAAVMDWEACRSPRGEAAIEVGGMDQP